MALIVPLDPSLTMASHQNSATSPVLIEQSSVSQISILNILPTMISMGMPASRLSSITVRSKLSFSVWKWKVICPQKKRGGDRVASCLALGQVYGIGTPRHAAKT